MLGLADIQDQVVGILLSSPSMMPFKETQIRSSMIVTQICNDRAFGLYISLQNCINPLFF